ncbi:MAG: hypothetical protein JWM31_2343, partial [Solirubrobacterales bacterium]|nr:hypothetical protein [Solirubrobacterales bacterium]
MRRRAAVPPRAARPGRVVPVLLLLVAAAWGPGAVGPPGAIALSCADAHPHALGGPRVPGGRGALVVGDS